jgi:hypothetical protein
VLEYAEAPDSVPLAAPRSRWVFTPDFHKLIFLAQLQRSGKLCALFPMRERSCVVCRLDQWNAGEVEEWYSLDARDCFAKRSRGQTSDSGYLPRLARGEGVREVSDPPAEDFEANDRSSSSVSIECPRRCKSRQVRVPFTLPAWLRAASH